MKLPVLVSIPHDGRLIPDEVAGLCRLSEEQIRADGDDGARAAYDVLRPCVAASLAAEVARAVVDLNRSEDDRGKDGVVKTHTCWDVPVYDAPLDDALVARLLTRYHRPYHGKLTDQARRARFGLDCHTMAAEGPPVGPDPGRVRPQVCLSDGRGETFPAAWTAAFAARLRAEFPGTVAVNDPFSGGHIVRAHRAEMPWAQIELSRDPWTTWDDKGRRVLRALETFCAEDLPMEEA